MTTSEDSRRAAKIRVLLASCLRRGFTAEQVASDPLVLALLDAELHDAIPSAGPASVTTYTYVLAALEAIYDVRSEMAPS